MQRPNAERGQATALVVLGLAFFLLAAVGLAIDGSKLYAERQLAQTAADAAAQAGMMSVFNGSPDAAAIGTTAFTCTSTTSTSVSPCAYAGNNGFTTSFSSGTCTPTAGSDCVEVNPNPGVPIAGTLDSSTPNELQVTISRAVPMTLTKMLPGVGNFRVTARATAAIVDVTSPVPIIITHPTMANALNMSGSAAITICGGPQRSIQINSNGTNPSGAAFALLSSGNVDLSKAGPADTSGNCTTGTGGDFGNDGGPTTSNSTTAPGNVLIGSSGHYLDPASPILDPLANVYPDRPGFPTGGPPVPATAPPPTACVGTHCNDCPAPGFTGTKPSTCTEYQPGLYSNLTVNGVSSAIFDPGLYYLQGGGFHIQNSTVQMCATCSADANTNGGMVIYDGGASLSSTATGGFHFGTGVKAVLWGAGVSASNPTFAPTAPYYGILFFENRHADTQTHDIGPPLPGCFSMIGTMYIHNLVSIMQGNANHYQTISYSGGSCSTASQGEIIANALQMSGNSAITMTLRNAALTPVRQIALVQ